MEFEHLGWCRNVWLTFYKHDIWCSFVMLFDIIVPSLMLKCQKCHIYNWLQLMMWINFFGVKEWKSSFVNISPLNNPIQWYDLYSVVRHSQFSSQSFIIGRIHSSFTYAFYWCLLNSIQWKIINKISPFKRVNFLRFSLFE